MEVWFTQSDLIGSKVIRKVTGESISHVVLAEDEWVIHSNFCKGLHIQSKSDFLKKNRVQYSVKVDCNLTKVFKILGKNWGAKYDFLALITLGMRLIAPKLLPKARLWQVSGMFICTEFVAQYLYEKELMLTPGQLFSIMKQDEIK